MAATRIDILKHVLTLIYIGKEVQKLFIDHGIKSLRKLLNVTYEA